MVARDWHANNQKWSESYRARVLKSLEDIYTKARQNAITGKLMPAAPDGSAAGVVIEALKRLKVDYRLVGAASAYNNGKSTQVAAVLEIKTSPCFKRVLPIGNRKLNG